MLHIQQECSCMMKQMVKCSYFAMEQQSVCCPFQPSFVLNTVDQDILPGLKLSELAYLKIVHCFLF